MVSLTINGVTYQYPEPDDENWGTNATGWAEEVTTVLAGVFEPASTPLASSGQFRLPNEGIIAWRDNANSADVKLYVHTDDDLYIQVGANPPINLSTTAAGNVTGPLSATDNAIARFDGTSGQTIQNSVVTVTDSGNVNNVNVLTAVQVDTTDLNSTTLVNSGDAFVDGDMELGDGTKATTTPSLLINADTGDAGIRLQVNNTSANAWDVYNDNSDGDAFKVAYNGADSFKLQAAGRYMDHVFSNTTDGGITIINTDTSGTGDAFIKLRVNNTTANDWSIVNDNSDSDRLKLSYAGTDRFTFESTGTDAIGFRSSNIATSSAPNANALYPHSMVKAWCKFRPDGTTTPVLSDRFNVDTLTVSGVTGTVTFHTAMANADYTITWGNAYMVAPIASYLLYVPAVVSQTTTGFTFVVFQMADTGDTITRTNIETLDFGSPATDSSLCFHVIGRQ